MSLKLWIIFALVKTKTASTQLNNNKKSHLSQRKNLTSDHILEVSLQTVDIIISPLFLLWAPSIMKGKKNLFDFFHKFSDIIFQTVRLIISLRCTRYIRSFSLCSSSPFFFLSSSLKVMVEFHPLFMHVLQLQRSLSPIGVWIKGHRSSGGGGDWLSQS